MIIKKIIAPEEWGMSTLKEFDFIHPEQKVAVKYNYWDYIDGFNKWWTLYGPSVKFLSESYKKLYLEWIDISPKLINLHEENIFFEGISLMYFFIEFSIPWIMKWSIEVNNTSEGFPCLQRTFYTNFWSKLLQKNPEVKLHGQEIIDLINVKISKYYDTATMGPQVMEDLSPFKKITRKLQIKKRLISKSGAIAIYLEEVKKDLMKNLDLNIKYDISMALASHTNEEDDTCIAGEGQDVDEEQIDVETILKRYQQQLEESSSTRKTCKGKEKQSLALNSSEQTIRLLNKRDIEFYKSQYKFLHIGMVQIAFKLLTLKGLPETFLAALRDARNLNFRQSLMGSIESTVAYGPIYFNAQPNLQLSLTDSNILDDLTLNVKTHGYNYAAGSELICFSYRIYYKLLATLNPRCKLYDTSDQTILVETNFARSKVTTRRPIK
ncbi:hypothetical protein H5410_051773 [Solanum commersonii]|uniref:Uncharacterized protein n=1 Tax=Solanum commersonii TaxID=4109 RepID=A0A9J5WZF8_SOLCO|nr:hypothetical protein H5410_051773 [Solanum commersonii]